jgi:hypothetical protein
MRINALNFSVYLLGLVSPIAATPFAPGGESAGGSTSSRLEVLRELSRRNEEGSSKKSTSGPSCEPLVEVGSSVS